MKRIPMPLPEPAPPQSRTSAGQFDSKYNPDYCAAIVEHMSDGASLTSFAASINVSPATVIAWAKEHSEFAEARSLAMAKCQAWWEAQLRAGLFDEAVHVSEGKSRKTTTRRANANIARLIMENLFRWSGRQAMEVDATVAPADGPKVDPSRLTLDEQREMVRLMHKAQGLDPDITKGPLAPPVRRLLDWADEE
jgi:hypothetical protein